MRAILWQRVGLPGSRGGLRSWAGPMAATCGWTFVGPPVIPAGCVRSRKSWSICNPMSSSGWAKDGGLLSFGTDMADEFHRAVPYVDRILRCAKPAGLPVQLPVKFELVVNAKTAKALGIHVPPTLLAR